MMKNQILDTIAAYPVIPVFYHDEVEICINVLKACYEGGIRVFEFVNRGAAATENFKALMAYKVEHFPDLKLGIGTILDTEAAKKFIKLGTEFLVSPIFTQELAKLAKEKGILWIPGCMTPSEIAAAMHAGCGFIKLFPGETLGTGFLKSIKPLFPTVKFMPTGGVDVTQSNIQNWFEAGVSAVGLGSKLFVKNQTGFDYQAISQNCRNLLSWVKK
ncbi:MULTISPECIES: bifunctional 4-hydroxy-2-oxoglutarate aldolase/2-dehydro-3-deoxy-phosphogluconate aldolase [Sphingobacterium]|uniref:Bifunctional 4-hydroxy-2-oxoglutarate aldolase/2-dehydro-3-deoxy-phosphogluconate aldolase n=1 Tax=Sphingobacterium tenebrionis TaxID=3111775 RepID=A0ABU8I4R8_9SPHI|nr:bifunctional 4-hydroxy-2-oxoglutarate aldolase/2-dehydro-3-deoxy-phosphogluconate aldolase [Sphingobacterium sp. 1.A.4]